MLPSSRLIALDAPEVLDTLHHRINVLSYSDTLVTRAISTAIESTTVDSIAIGRSYTAAPTVIEPLMTVEFN